MLSCVTILQGSITLTTHDEKRYHFLSGTEFKSCPGLLLELRNFIELLSHNFNVGLSNIAIDPLIDTVSSVRFAATFK